MTQDQKFLKDNRITVEPADTWMEWRTDEVRDLRLNLANATIQTRQERARGDRWKLIAWSLAVVLGIICANAAVTRFWK